MPFRNYPAGAQSSGTQAGYEPPAVSKAAGAKICILPGVNTMNVVINNQVVQLQNGEAYFGIDTQTAAMFAAFGIAFT